MISVNDKTFIEETDKFFVLVDFWAACCGPCHMQAPILEQLAEEYDETELKIVKMDVDENPITPFGFNILSIPTLVLKKNGEAVETLVGVHSKEQLKEILKKHI
ncbi:MAG: thioredoxin [Streptococcaceae bacterium]|jgi:thioredoxin 1|nr:thioredoxin [Streptococcaceae bacterium]